MQAQDIFDEFVEGGDGYQDEIFSDYLGDPDILAEGEDTPDVIQSSEPADPFTDQTGTPTPAGPFEIGNINLKAKTQQMKRKRTAEQTSAEEEEGEATKKPKVIIDLTDDDLALFQDFGSMMGHVLSKHSWRKVSP